ncbi:ATP-dependent zinc metalloprotease FtsH [compost metagenome]
MVDRIAIMAGGRVAEELIFGKENITSGASSDIQQATKLARRMVTQWGFSDVLGTVAYGENEQEVFLGHSVARSQNISEETARLIDSEVKKLVTSGWDEARQILTDKAADLEKLAQALLEYETLSGAEITDLLERGVTPNRDDANSPVPGPSVSVPVTPVSDGTDVETPKAEPAAAPTTSVPTV